MDGTVAAHLPKFKSPFFPMVVVGEWRWLTQDALEHQTAKHWKKSLMLLSKSCKQ